MVLFYQNELSERDIQSLYSGGGNRFNAVILKIKGLIDLYSDESTPDLPQTNRKAPVPTRTVILRFPMAPPLKEPIFVPRCSTSTEKREIILQAAQNHDDPEQLLSMAERLVSTSQIQAWDYLNHVLPPEKYITWEQVALINTRRDFERIYAAGRRHYSFIREPFGFGPYRGDWAYFLRSALDELFPGLMARAQHAYSKPEHYFVNRTKQPPCLHFYGKHGSPIFKLPIS